jgi:epoxide hydrolase
MSVSDGSSPVSGIEPFVLEVADATLDDLRDRLRRTRFPSRETVDDWNQGLPLGYARELRDHWLNVYDWRPTEATLNDLGQFTTTIDGVSIHFLHVRSPVDDARPLLLSHGWPGSVVEFLDIIGPLTDPTAHGGDPADAFHVVAPSLPGYGFSAAPAEPGWTTERIADAWVTLMDRLGYVDWVAQGGDWGAVISTDIALRHPDTVAGIHLNMPLVRPTTRDLTDAERAAEERYRQGHLRWGTGYADQQSTRPQTLGYGLADSPMAQAAWIIEKFHAWTDHDGDHEEAVSRDRLLDNVMLYWLGNTGASSARLYWESYGRTSRDPVEVPTGCSIFPKEIFPASRRFVEARFTDLRHWSEHPRGGHFAALEQPEALVADVREFARCLPRPAAQV